ncbi:hypothetical protein CBR_g6390 [Chara braunii]|uniref:Uncharacterized protein n=1 Tax=Chara braunii TaxID=69332 RepID=A0A388KJN3_CHABU|nr:hypothetical protein CBR_g6390 [Chara braunii]|eukprot:GBG70261.1 hypothetical protein CBR_g6390 [Chara braunii]
MSMSVTQVEKALAEVMKYAAEGIHYNGDIEFSLVKERVPRYFAVSVDMRSTIMANDEGCVKAQMLLQRFRESPCVRVDNEVEHSPYSLKGVVQWMCNEGMCEDGDMDMTIHQKGGTYAPADFKKLLGTVAKNSDMLVDGSKDELKSGAAEILVLSKMKDIIQTQPQDFQDVPVIVADGVEYVLLDQLCDFMKKSDEDRNVIHEALHEVTEFALQGKDLIEFVPARGEDDFISDRPLWGDLLSCKMDSGPQVCDCVRSFMSLQTLNSHRARACPAVVDERAQGQEMGVVDACGPSNIGAVNLVSDESEDIGAPENADGEGGSFAEQQPPPVESFDNSRKLEALIFSARGGVGMSQSDIDALLSLLKDPRFNTTDIVYCNSRECLTWAGSLAEAAGLKESDLRNADWPRDAHAILWHRDWRTTFLSIFNIALQKCETVSSLEVSPPSEDLSKSGPRAQRGAIGAENRLPRAPEKRSREDQITKVHRTTKKRISYKKDTTVDMIDLRGSDNMHSGARKEAEEEHDHPLSEKSDREDDNASRDEVDDSETSHGHPRDSDEADDDDGGSDDGTAHEESDDGSTQDDRSASRRANDTNSQAKVCANSEGQRQVNEESGAFTKRMRGRLFRSVTKAFAFSAAKDATLYPTEDAFFTSLQTTTKLVGEIAEEGLRSHVASCGFEQS